MTSNSGRGPKKKIVRVSEKYGLDNIGTEMAEKWINPDQDSRYTLEELRDLFNKRVLEAAIEKVGGDSVPGEVEYAYTRLFDDSTNPSEKEDTRRRLEEKGVDVEQVIEEFISSPQTIHNYLRQVEDVELNNETDDKTQKEKMIGHIRSLERRYETIVDDLLSRLIKSEDIPDSEYGIDIECVVTDPETGEQMYVEELLEEK